MQGGLLNALLQRLKRKQLLPGLAQLLVHIPLAGGKRLHGRLDTHDLVWDPPGKQKIDRRAQDKGKQDVQGRI